MNIRRTAFLCAAFAVSGLAHGGAAAIDPPVTNTAGETALMLDIRLKPGAEGVFEDEMSRAVLCSRLEAGNIAYSVHKVFGTTGRYILYEVWRTPELFSAHLEQPYAVRLIGLLDAAAEKSFENSIVYLGDFMPPPRAEPPLAPPQTPEACRAQ